MRRQTRIDIVERLHEIDASVPEMAGAGPTGWRDTLWSAANLVAAIYARLGLAYLWVYYRVKGWQRANGP
jgi:hypothetical protein